MAKRRRPDPEVTEEWAQKLREVTERLGPQQQVANTTRAEREDLIRGAFKDGVWVSAIHESTGLSKSRLFQIKFAGVEKSDED
jgi:hypothetical protein